jgi:hypothetical protein
MRTVRKTFEPHLSNDALPVLSSISAKPHRKFFNFIAGLPHPDTYAVSSFALPEEAR